MFISYAINSLEYKTLQENVYMNLTNLQLTNWRLYEESWIIWLNELNIDYIVNPMVNDVLTKHT